MHTAEVVNKDSVQWVRLPHGVTIEAGRLEILHMGDSLLLTPAPRAGTPPFTPPPNAPRPSAAAMPAPRSRPGPDEDDDAVLDESWRRLNAEETARRAGGRRGRLSFRATA